MKTYFFSSILLLSFSAFGVGSTTGTLPLMMKASLELNDSGTEMEPLFLINDTGSPLSSVFHKAISKAAAELSNGDTIFANEILKSYDHDITLDLIKNNPSINFYNSITGVRSIAKISTGVSYLDKSDLIDGAKAIKALSSQHGLLEDFSEMDLIDIWEASQGVKEWSL